MMEVVITRVLRAVFGGGANISAANPLPVDTSPGNKAATQILSLASIALGATSRLADCVAVDLRGGQATLAITTKARYNAAAVRGIRLHVRTSPTNSATGTHTGAVHLTIMTDAVAHFAVNELIGLTIQNVTDGSSGVITANTETTVTVAALAGGTTNRWNTNDQYSISGADYDTYDWDVSDLSFAAGAVLRETHHYDTDPMYVKVLVENLDAAQTVTDVRVTSTRGV